MAETAKYQLVPNGHIFSDIKGQFSLFKTRKTSTYLVYGVVLIFIFLTVFLAFSPSSSTSSSPWYISFFTLNSTWPPSTTLSNQPDNRSHFSPISSTDSSQIIPQISPSRSQDNTFSQVPTSQNLTKTDLPPDIGENSGQKVSNQSVASPQNPEVKPFLSHNISNSQVPTLPNLNKTQILPDVDNYDLEINCMNQTCNGQKQTNQTIQVSQSPQAKPPIGSQDVTISQQPIITNSSVAVSASTNVTKTPVPEVKGETLNQSDEKQSKQSEVIPQATQLPQNSTSGLVNSTKNLNGNEVEGVKEKPVSSDLAASLSKQSNQQGNGNESVSVSGELKKQGNEGKDLIGSLVGCDLYDGGWVRDESYPLYKPGSCSLIDEQFNCIRNGRPDHDFHKLKWQPKGCSLPRLSAGHMLKLLKGKRLVFVGDSLNRNMWESLVCILRSEVKDKKKVYEAYGRHTFRTGASYIFVFKEYNFTVEFFVAPFLVQQWDLKEKTGEVKETLRLDLMVSDAHQFKDADFLVFNTGHWWTHGKTSKGEDYFQEGSHVYKQLDVQEAFRRAITTWARWIDANVNPQKTHVLFRGYSASHFSGGQWNSGGACDNETEPIRDDNYLTQYPWKMKVFERVIQGMKTPVSLLNVTRMTDYRKDGHPSIYRKQNIPEEERKSPMRYQDCSHWCLPGVPDSWNELLYAELLRKQYVDQQQKNKR